MRPYNPDGLVIGLAYPPEPPLSDAVKAVEIAKAAEMESLTIWDHLAGFTPRFLWDEHTESDALDSPNEYFEFQTLLGYLAKSSKNIRIGVGVTEPIRRHPIILAQAALTLSHLSVERPILGIGAGEKVNIEPYGLATSEPVGRLEEALAIIRMSFTAKGPLNYQGKWFELSDALLDLSPGPGGVPEIWLGGRGPRMLRLTGQWADAWYPADILDPQTYSSGLDDVRRHAMRSGRNPDAITPAVELVVIFGGTDAEAQAQLREPPVKLLGLLAPSQSWEAFGLTHPLGQGFRGFVDFLPSAYGESELEEIVNSVPVDFVEGLVLWGTPRRVATQLRALEEAGLRHAVLSLARDDVRNDQHTVEQLLETKALLD